MQKIIIIGAGFAGIIAALRLIEQGHLEFEIWEKASGVGGTWRDNVYPGCACDVPAHLYSIKQVPNPHWSRLFATQPEILRYIQEVVTSKKLEKYIRFGRELREAEFVESEGHWKITDQHENIAHTQVLMMATGPLSRPNIPRLEGQDAFKGRQLHTAEWDKTVDFAGKKVAVIGTGASTIQLIPALADKFGEMTVFQRTAAWVSPRNDQPIGEGLQKTFERWPLLQKFVRTVIYWILEIRGRLFIGNKWMQMLVQRQCLGHLGQTVQDEATRQKLTPDYKLGCKRILYSDDFYPVFNRPNVHLVTEPIARLCADGLETKDGQKIEADIIVYGTGFEASEITTSQKIFGINGLELFSHWKATGLQAYKGTVIAGFPNLLFILGPNTGLGHTSVLHMMESQMNYVLSYLTLLSEKGSKGYLDVKAESQQRFNEELQTKFKGTVWASGCKSWYLDSKGRNTTLYPRLTVSFRALLSRFDSSVFQTSEPK